MPRTARRLLLLALLAPVLLPLLSTLIAWSTPASEIWAHQWQYALPRVATNSLILILFVGTGATLLGATLAWWVTICDFPGRKIFEWALLLPLALPGYVLAVAYVGLLDFTGPVQTTLRNLGISLTLPSLRSTGGAALVLILTLYPYVFMLAKTAFSGLHRSVEVARTLGFTESQIFWRVALPLARPALVAGAALIVMEVLADFGVMAALNVDTLTTTIYRVWFGFFAFDAALQLASVLALLALTTLIIERRMRGARSFAEKNPTITHRPLRTLPRPTAILLSTVALLVLMLGFGIPVLQLGSWALKHLATDLDARYFEFASRSVSLAAMGAIIVTLAALLRGFALRDESRATWKSLADMSLVGYAIPGTVLAVGIFVPLAQTWVAGTLFATLLAYLVRFHAVGAGALDSGFARIPYRLDEATRLLDHRFLSGWRRVQLPLLSGSLVTSAVLVFVELMKELPITLLTRPFGFDTLAVRVFELTAEGEWERAALPSLAIVAAGLIPVFLLARRIGGNQAEQA